MPQMPKITRRLLAIYGQFSRILPCRPRVPFRASLEPVTGHRLQRLMANGSPLLSLPPTTNDQQLSLPLCRDSFGNLWQHPVIYSDFRTSPFGNLWPSPGNRWQCMGHFGLPTFPPFPLLPPFPPPPPRFVHLASGTPANCRRQACVVSKKCAGAAENRPACLPAFTAPGKPAALPPADPFPPHCFYESVAALIFSTALSFSETLSFQKSCLFRNTA